MLAICQQFSGRKNWVYLAKTKRVRSDEEGLETGRQTETILYWVSTHQAEDWADHLGSGNYYSGSGRPGRVGFDLDLVRTLC